MKTDQQYQDLQKAYTKEVFASIIKTDVRNRFTEPYASIYCRQFDDAKRLADFLETASKLIRKQ